MRISNVSVIIKNYLVVTGLSNSFCDANEQWQKQPPEVSSNINEVIRTVLIFLIFLQKDFTSTKKHKTVYNEQK